ncbi:polyprenyl synthetase family protein [candidate division WOR-3 bacterium]|nr:polyprenyl synthetase family protein [candidate division WOR-3 bacterium]
MNIENYLKDWKKKVDDKLNEHLPSEEEYPPLLHKAMRYSVLAGGKRIRAILMITTYSLSGGKHFDEIMPVSSAIEFIHSYSLIHDDLPAMDNDDYRRGILSSHKKFGEDIAILAGDALFSHAFYMISHSNIRADLKEETLRVLTRAIGNKGIIGGQIEDVISDSGEKNPKLLRYIHSHKTASFFSAVCEIGTILADANKEKISASRKGGLLIGMAFQIQDDILDVEGKKEEMGKEVKKDKNKLTYPSVYGIDFSRKIAKKYSMLALKQLNVISGNDKIFEDLLDFLLGRRN